MRLIDADALSRRIDYCVVKGLGSTIAFTFKHMIKESPTIDAVPVIRCKDCKWCVELYDIDIDTIVPYLQCTNWNGMTDADGYCCVAERKEE